MIISTVIREPGSPRKLLLYIYCPILIINSATFHSQKCLGLDVNYMVTLITDVGWERSDKAVKTCVSEPNSSSVYLCIPDLLRSSLINSLSITEWHATILIQFYDSVGYVREGIHDCLVAHLQIFCSHCGPTPSHRVLFRWRRVSDWKGQDLFLNLRSLC